MPPSVPSTPFPFHRFAHGYCPLLHYNIFTCYFEDVHVKRLLLIEVILEPGISLPLYSLLER